MDAQMSKLGSRDMNDETDDCDETSFLNRMDGCEAQISGLLQHFPAKFEEHFTEIEKTDSKLQNIFNEVEKSLDAFFNSKNMPVVDKNANYKSINDSYDELLKNTDWKIYHTEQLYTIVEKLLQHLDCELYKFKMELEVDNPGITQILEKKISSSTLPLPPGVKIKTERKSR